MSFVHRQYMLPHLYAPKKRVAVAAEQRVVIKQKVRKALQSGLQFPSGHPVITYQLKPRSIYNPKKAKTT